MTAPTASTKPALRDDVPDLPDYSTKAGAKLLLSTIKSYWKFRGHDVAIWIYEVPGHPRHFGIKSNLVNGVPVQRARLAAAA